MRVFLLDDRGATSVEYGLIVGLFSVSIVLAAGFVGQSIGTIFTDISNFMAGLL